MISYQDGTEMKVGDSVLIEEGGSPGVVIALIESAAEQSESNVEEPGVMIESAPFGTGLHSYFDVHGGSHPPGPTRSTLEHVCGHDPITDAGMMI